MKRRVDVSSLIAEVGCHGLVIIIVMKSCRLTVTSVRFTVHGKRKRYRTMTRVRYSHIGTCTGKHSHVYTGTQLFCLSVCRSVGLSLSLSVKSVCVCVSLSLSLSLSLSIQVCINVRVLSILQLTVSLVNPFTAPAGETSGLKSAHTVTPANSRFSAGSITNLISILRVLLKILSHINAKNKTKRMNNFNFRTFIVRFQVTSWRQ